MIKPFPPLPPNWNVSRVAEDHFRIDDRYKGHLFSGSQDQCEAFITQGARLQQLEAFAQRVYDSHGLMHDGTLYEESKRLVGDQRDLYQVRDGNTGRVLSAHPTIDDANEVAFSIENGAPYSGVPASALAVEFWKRQPDGQYHQMTPGQVERDLEAGPPGLAREAVEPHQQYRALLEQISDLRYPSADAQLRARIEASIDRRVADFLAERGELPKHARAREQQQQIQPPPPRQQQRGMSYDL
jgi:hypothetical protein